VNYYDFAAEPAFFLFLLEIDRCVAVEAHGRPCAECGGKLDVANFWRSGYGLPEGAVDECRMRFSFSCRSAGCRMRETPESLRFLRGKAYVSIVIVLISAVRHGLSPERVKALTTRLKVSRQTVANWLKWWREHFPSTDFWKTRRAYFMPSLEEMRLSLSLLEVFGNQTADTRDGVERLLRWLSAYRPTPR
jgi:hypothetical protein